MIYISYLCDGMCEIPEESLQPLLVDGCSHLPLNAGDCFMAMGTPKKDLRGKRFGKLTVTEYLGNQRWMTICDCGEKHQVRGDHLRSGAIQQCKKCAIEASSAKSRLKRIGNGKPRIDLVGKRFGTLVVASYNGNGKWNCISDSGAKCIRDGFKLRHNKTGRGRQDILIPRTLYPREYSCWSSMKRRCKDKSHGGHYREKGIAVCDRWALSFEAFLSDMGPAPSPKHSIDRINNDMGYFPGNCRLATQKEQCNNTDENIRLSHNGETHTISEWSERFGIKPETARSRYYRGCTFEGIFYVPVKKRPLTDDEVRAIRELHLTVSSFERMFGKKVRHDVLSHVRLYKSYKDVK